MIRNSIPFLLLAAVAALPVSGSTVSFDWATVGNPGNVADRDGRGYGAVDYVYRIGKHEVTNAQYTAFLNAVDPTGDNALGLYNSNMAANYGGIELRAGNSDGSKFVAQAAREQNPVTFVSFVDAMRFTNWLHNGQGSGDTEAGAYTIGIGLDEVRSASAKYWIPSEDEWYKAAYHDASAGTAGVYFIFATGSDSVPVSDHPDDNPAAVNYFNDDGVANGFNDGFAVSGSSNVPISTNPFTNVGAYTAAASPYGTFDQNGNVSEWNETIGFGRGFRGGAWRGDPGALRATQTGSVNARLGDDRRGFRVATVAEPSTIPGDFNADGVVDAADYTVWRDGLGTMYTPSDYDAWAVNFGAIAPVTSTAIPEPTAGVLLLIAATAGQQCRRN